MTILVYTSFNAFDLHNFQTLHQHPGVRRGGLHSLHALEHQVPQGQQPPHHFITCSPAHLLTSSLHHLLTCPPVQVVDCLTEWRDLWLDEAFWHLLFSALLCVIMVLWRPSQVHPTTPPPPPLLPSSSSSSPPPPLLLLLPLASSPPSSPRITSTTPSPPSWTMAPTAPLENLLF